MHARRLGFWLAMAILGATIGTVPVSADGGAVLVAGSTLPDVPPLDGVIRLDLTVRNGTTAAWRPADLMHLIWRTGSGQSVADDQRPLGVAVAPNATAHLTFVTLAPAQVGDFTLTTQLQTGATMLPVGAVMPYHLSGFLFQGKGNGHGLGMSQWGARGRAEAGQSYRTILAAYYQGTRIETRDTSGSVRIALTHGALDLARPWARLFGPFPQIAGPLSIDGLALQVGAGAALGFAANSAGQPTAFVQAPDGTQGAPVVLSGPITVHAQGAAGLRTNLAQTLDSDFRTGSEQRRYAGTLRIIPTDGARILPVNVLPMEDYLKGVVPAEMPAYWGNEALKAQAVAARTYAMRKIALGGSGADFDLEGNEFDQAYSGLSDQRSATTSAVDATRGQVLTSGGHLIDALFTASNGGHSSDSEYGFIHWNHGLKPAARISYLRGISDPLDRAPSWQVGPFSPTDAATILRDSGEDIGDRLLGIDVLQRSPAGRIMGVRLRGSGSTDEVSGPVLRSYFGLPDTLVDVVGGS
ncbi:MAG TPA: SpoIID/LytB domain-containing protein [Candidatus Limnocylindrales bacterium]|nr:SpoIID/LytB domain-containing protein [Candidatus Limnocylindrales bacterium]